jgi:hypothetical protein
MAQTDLAIRIATILDASGFKNTDKAIGNLQKSASKLGKTLGIALSTAAVVSFGKASVDAFIQGEKTSALLALAVKNLGMEMSQPRITKFIDNLSQQVAIVGGELEPAFQSLIQTTKDLAASEQLLVLATEVSRGSNQDLATVVSDLNAAYAGNMKGLKKYNLGLTSAELQTKSFAEVTQLLNNQFKGANAAYLKTYAGQIQTLATASDKAKSIIGEGLVNALIAITGSLDITDMSNKIVTLATNLADIFVKLGNLIGQNIAFIKMFGVAIISVFTATKVYAGALAMISIIEKIRKAFKLMREMSIGAAIASMAAINPVAALLGGTALIASIVAATKLMDALTTKDPVDIIAPPDFSGLDDPKFKKIEADRIKAEKMKAANLKKEMASRKALSIFDLEAIQIMAALKGQISDDERKRLELQLAIITGAEGQAQKLTGELAKSQGLTVALTQWLMNLPAAKNPFMAWKGYLDEVELQAKRIADIGKNGEKALSPKLDFGGNVLGTPVPGFEPPNWAKQLMSSGAPSFAGQDFYGAMGAASPIVNVSVVLDNGVVAGAIRDVSVNDSLSGSFNSVNRRGRFENQVL